MHFANHGILITVYRGRKRCRTSFNLRRLSLALHVGQAGLFFLCHSQNGCRAPSPGFRTPETIVNTRSLQGACHCRPSVVPSSPDLCARTRSRLRRDAFVHFLCNILCSVRRVAPHDSPYSYRRRRQDFAMPQALRVHGTSAMSDRELLSLSISPIWSRTLSCFIVSYIISARLPAATLFTTEEFKTVLGSRSYLLPRRRMYSQGEVVYKNLQMSQGVYFVTRGIAEAYVNVGIRDSTGRKAETEEKVKGIVSVGKIFGYTRCALPRIWAFLSPESCQKAFAVDVATIFSLTFIS